MVRFRLPRRNFCIRLRHNALSRLEVYKINLSRNKFRRYANIAGFLPNPHPIKRAIVSMSLFYLIRARRIQNKPWVNPVPLENQRKTMIDEWDEEILYQDFGFEKRQLRAILLVICIEIFGFNYKLTYLLHLLNLFVTSRPGEFHSCCNFPLANLFLERQLYCCYCNDGISPAN